MHISNKAKNIIQKAGVFALYFPFICVSVLMAYNVFLCWLCTENAGYSLCGNLTGKANLPDEIFSFVLVNVLLLPIYLSYFTTKKWKLRLFWLLGWPLLLVLTLKLYLML